MVMEEIMKSEGKSNKGGGREDVKLQSCPLCNLTRITDREEFNKCKQRLHYYVTYAYRIRSEVVLRIATKSKQRGGPSRLLSTKPKEHLVNKL